MSSSSSSNSVSDASRSDLVCPSCRLPFDKGKKRRLVDTSCGHHRCYQCMFRKQECPVCKAGNQQQQQQPQAGYGGECMKFISLDPPSLLLSMYKMPPSLSSKEFLPPTVNPNTAEQKSGYADKH